MMNIIRRLIHSNKPPKAVQIFDNARFKEFFWLNPHNHWLLEDKYVARNIDELFSLLDQEALDYFSRHPLVFVPSTGQLSCALGGIAGIDVIILFPELLRMLRSLAPRMGLAILAHELGHLINAHYDKPIDRLEAQVEADLYATRIGFGQELQEVLLQFDEEDCRVRVTYITSQMAANGELESPLTLKASSH